MVKDEPPLIGPVRGKKCTCTEHKDRCAHANGSLTAWRTPITFDRPTSAILRAFHEICLLLRLHEKNASSSPAIHAGQVL